MQKEILMRIVALALTLTLSALGGAPAWFTSLWSGSSADIGCGMDPSGCPASRPSADAGCGADPNGCPTAPQPTPYEGCGWDPDGRQCS
ncbi:MAG TPA: hypothetical protein VF756_09355 [Thermoanaerobaculia bacterium]